MRYSRFKMLKQLDRSDEKNPPQFRLRTLLVLFFCLAVGLTVGAKFPTQTWTFQGTVEESSRLNWLYVLLGTGSASMVLGLLQYVGRLRKLDLPVTGSRGYRSAFSFAIAWRVAIAIAITACLITIMLYQRGRVELPERDSYLYYGNVFPDFLWFLCIIVVLTSTIVRCNAPSHTPRWMVPVLWVCGTIIVTKVLTHRMLIHYLVYVAISGVERHEPLRFQRAGAYSHHQADGFWFFWLSLAAVCCSIVGAAIVVWLLKGRISWSIKRTMAGSVAFAFLCFSLVYSVWYYGWGLPREAPDFATVGPCATWLDWIGAGLVILMVIIVGGYRMAVEKDNYIERECSGIDSSPLLHQTFWIILVFLGAILACGIEVLKDFYDQANVGLGFRDIADYALTQTETYLFGVMSLVLIQYTWCWRKNRMRSSNIRIAMLDSRRFCFSCLVLILLIAICIPIFAAYSFAYWLGPWYLE